MKCEKASILAQMAEEQSLSFIDNIKLNIHVFICGPCKWFADQNNMLSNAVAKMYCEPIQNKKLTDLQKQNMIQSISERL